MNQVSENIRYLLWQRRVSQTAWVETISQIIECDLISAHRMLEGELKGNEAEKLAQYFDVDVTELQYAKLISSEAIWQGNVIYLLNRRKRGELGQVQTFLGLKTAAAISNWKSGKKIPPVDKYKDKLSEFCGLAENIDLEKVPLFLFDSPIDSLSRRQWLHEQLEQLDDTTLHALFPAFERLFKP